MYLHTQWHSAAVIIVEKQLPVQPGNVISDLTAHNPFQNQFINGINVQLLTLALSNVTPYCAIIHTVTILVPLSTDTKCTATQIHKYNKKYRYEEQHVGNFNRL